MLALRAGYSWPNLNSGCPRPAGGGPGGRRPPGTLRPMGRCWVRPAGMLTPALTELAGFVASSKIERPPTRLTSPPPHLRWRPTSPRQVGGGGPTLAANVPTSGGGGGAYVGLRRPPCEGTLARYIAVVPPSHLKGPLLLRSGRASLRFVTPLKSGATRVPRQRRMPPSRRNRHTRVA